MKNRPGGSITWSWHGHIIFINYFCSHLEPMMLRLLPDVLYQCYHASLKWATHIIFISIKELISNGTELGEIYLWTGKNIFAKFFVFAKILDRKDRKSGVRLVIDYADTKICEKPSDFSKTVRVVVDYADKCPRSSWLRWNDVCIVIDYADTVSA